MLQEEEKVVAPEEKSEETITLSADQVKQLKEKGEVTVEIEDVDLGLGENDVERMKEEVEKKVLASHVLNPQQQEVFAKIMEEAKMPVKMTDGKFQMGENELDIRYLSRANLNQMMFRTGVLSNVYGKQILTSLIDITRLLMVLCDKLGVEDIDTATDVVIEKAEQQHKLKEQLKKESNKQTVEETDEEGNKA